MKCKASQDGNRVSVVCKRHRNFVDEDWNEDSAASACKDHTDKFVGDRSSFGCCFEHLAAV